MTAATDALRRPRHVFFLLAAAGIASSALTVVSLLLGNLSLASAFFVSTVVCWAAIRALYAGYWRWQGTEGVRRSLERLETRVDEAQAKSRGKN